MESIYFQYPADPTGYPCHEEAHMRMKGALAAGLLLALTVVLPVRNSHAGEGTDVQAEIVLKVCCDRLATLKSYSFLAEVDRDFAFPTGDSIRLSQAITTRVQRPNRFRCDIIGDDRDGAYVYDGKTLVSYDADANVYGTVEGRGSTDATVQHVIDQYGLQAPLANLLYSAPCASFDLDKVTGRYLGLHSAAGRPCHHLVFFGQDMNWQIWIDEADGLPRKIVVTDKSLPGWPQYTAVLSKWNTEAKFASSIFVFTPPKGAREIPVLPLGQGNTGN